MKTSTIVNERSGGWAEHKGLLTKLADQSDSPIFHAGGEKPVDELVREAIRGGCQRLIVAGGDGSVSHIVNTLAPEFGDVELAILPTGTGNDLARSIGAFSDSLEDAWRIALEGEARMIDVIRVTNGVTSYIVNAATGGFGGKVSTDVHSDEKQRWGAVAYWMTAFSKLTDLDSYQIRMELDDQSIVQPLYSVAVANGRYVGGGFPVASMAYVNDGLIDVIAVPELPALELIAAGIDFTLGRHPETNPAKTYQTTQLRIHSEPDLPFSLDGEPTRAIDAKFEVLPAVLPMVCGSTAPALLSNPRAEERVEERAEAV